MARRGKSRGKGKSRRSRIAAASPAQLQAINKAIADAEAAGLTSTSGYRGPEHKLTKRNPSSLHARARAFDLRAKTPAQAARVIAAQKAIFDARGLVEGRDYRIVNEVLHPSRHATAKHVHVEFTPAGMDRYQGTASSDVVANVPTPTARPSLPGDAFTPDVISPEAAASPRGTVGGLLGNRASLSPDRVGQYQTGLMPPGSGSMQGQEGGGFVNRDFAPESKFAPSPFGASPQPAPPSADRLGGLRPEALPGLTAVTPTARPSMSPSTDRLGGLRPEALPGLTTATPSARPPQADDFNRPDLSAFQQPTPGLGGLIGGPPAGQETASFTPSLKSIIASPAVIGEATAEAKPTLPDRAAAPTLADRAMQENLTSSLPSLGPPVADRPAVAKTIAAAQPAATAVDALDAMMKYDEDDTAPAREVRDLPVNEVEQAAPAAKSVDDNTYPEAPPEPTLSPFQKSFYDIGVGQVAKNAVGGLLRSGPIGGLLGGLGTLAWQNMKPGFDAAVPESSRFSVGSGLTGINAALSGPKGATATSRTQKGASVTSLGNGQSLRRSDRYGWTEVVGPDGSVVGIQYDNPTGKGILGKSILGNHQGLFGWASTKAGSTFGGPGGLSPAASRSIAAGKGGLY